MVRRFWIGALIIGSFLVISVLPLSDVARGILMGVLIYATLMDLISQRYNGKTMGEVVGKETLSRWLKWKVPIIALAISSAVWFVFVESSQSSFIEGAVSMLLLGTAFTGLMFLATAKMAYENEARKG